MKKFQVTASKVVEDEEILDFCQEVKWMMKVL